MEKKAGAVLVSPAEMDRFEACQARFWHELHNDGSGRLPTGDAAARLGLAIHHALMGLLLWVDSGVLLGKRPVVDEARDALTRRLRHALRTERIDPDSPAVAAGLARFGPGLDAAISLTVDDADGFFIDPGSGHRLVWSERLLGHGSASEGVELSADVVVRTRADMVGIRDFGDGPTVVVRAYNTRSHPGDPESGNGLLVQAVWAMGETEEARAPWFLRDRPVRPNADVNVEVVNLQHVGADVFHRQAQHGHDALEEHRDRLVRMVRNMAAVAAHETPVMVPASPGDQCHEHCPVLHRCGAGRAFVEHSASPAVLAERLAELGMPYRSVTPGPTH